MIYADNAATTKLDKVALEAMLPWLSEEYGNSSQPYSFARKPKKALSEARRNIAKCINASPEEIYFTSGGSESDNWAIKSTCCSVLDKNEIITSSIEHHAVLHSCEKMAKLGYSVQYVEPTHEGIITVDALKKAISPKTSLVSVMFANNEIGSIQPIKDLCRIAHNNGVIFHTDAVQAVGHINIDVKDLGVDLLSASAHKFNGPKGVGFLYVRQGTKIASFIDGGAQEFGYRAGTENIASIVGMATALISNQQSLENNSKHIRILQESLIKKLSVINPVINGGTHVLPGLTSVSFCGKDGEAILHRMDLMGISISTGAACNSRETEISHVLKAIGLSKELAIGTIRISLGKNNTIEDVDRIADSLIKILSKD